MAISAAMLAGCTNTAGVQVRAGDNMETSTETFSDLDGVEIQQIKGDYVNGENYRARVMIRNTEKDTKTIQYQFTWYDPDGMQVDPEGNAWTPLTLTGKDEKTVQAISPSPNVNGFRLNVRDLKADKTFKTNFFGKK
ncbi:MAG TPA: YcfL family protein [Pseudomonadales bacterium]|nr:YcfL family protein [Pseudomonadales bacterium]